MLKSLLSAAALCTVYGCKIRRGSKKAAQCESDMNRLNVRNKHGAEVTEVEISISCAVL